LRNITLAVIQDLIKDDCLALSATQKRLCVPIINRIYKKMSAGIKFSGIKVSGTLIGDGHHRYIASVFAQADLDRIPTFMPSATEAVDWSSVIFDEEDWDTPAKIKMLNQQDANYNDMPFEKIVSLLV